MSLFLVIIMGILFLFTIGLAFCFLLYNDDYTSFCGMLIISAFVGAMFGLFVYIYSEPHHGASPDFDDVTKNEAYIDTTTIINHNDTTYEYQIKWKD